MCRISSPVVFTLLPAAFPGALEGNILFIFVVVVLASASRDFEEETNAEKIVIKESLVLLCAFPSSTTRKRFGQQ